MIKEIKHRIKIRKDDPQLEAETLQGAGIRGGLSAYKQFLNVITDHRAEVEAMRIRYVDALEVGLEDATYLNGRINTLYKILAMIDGE